MTADKERAATARQADVAGSTSAAPAAGAANGGPSSSSAPPEEEGAPLLPQEEQRAWWDLLHESIREAVLSYLTARDLARIAWTCRDFAARVRHGRVNARSLVIPTGDRNRRSGRRRLREPLRGARVSPLPGSAAFATTKVPLGDRRQAWRRQTLCCRGLPQGRRVCVCECAGVTLRSITGMVVGHPNARAVSLVRYGAAQLRDADFSALIRAVAQVSTCRRSIAGTVLGCGVKRPGRQGTRQPLEDPYSVRRLAFAGAAVAQASSAGKCPRAARCACCVVDFASVWTPRRGAGAQQGVSDVSQHKG